MERLAAACRELADARLKHHDVTDMLAAVRSMAGDAMTATGRLLLPQLVEGRVLYLDSDTMTCADVRSLFEIDMGTAAIGAVRNYSLLGMLFEKHHTQRSEFDAQVDLMKPFPVSMYFDPGVMLMDCSAIKRDEEIMRKMQDVSTAERRFSEQDLLNLALKNQVHYLDHSWNCIWGQSGSMARTARICLPENPDRSPIPAKIVHFTGARKPWDPLGSWCLRMSGVKMLPAIYRYRMIERRLSKFLGKSN